MFQNMYVVPGIQQPMFPHTCSVLFGWYRQTEYCNGEGGSPYLEQLKPDPRGRVGKHHALPIEIVCRYFAAFCTAYLSFALGHCIISPSFLRCLRSLCHYHIGLLSYYSFLLFLLNPLFL